MKIIRKPQISAFIIALISTFYAFVFILVSGHIEFERMLNNTNTLNSAFWNSWSSFLQQGNLKYVGYAYIVLASAIVLLSLLRKKDYDEYQMGILEKGFLIIGITMVLLFPLVLLLILSDPNYSIEVIILLVVAHWSVALIADLIYIIKWGKG